MSPEEMEAMSKLDQAADEAGGFVDFTPPGRDVHYNYSAISKYCKEKGIEPIDMTIRELNKFIVP